VKITYTKSIKQVHFDDISCGEWFIDQDDQICMKISHNGVEGAVCFSDKVWYSRGVFNCIKPVEVELIVYAEEP
jgi:hypothetical protein